MSKSNDIFRVHPSIGFARVGNSDEYYLGPETMAGRPIRGDRKTMGGLPIKQGTEKQTITSEDIRDKNNALKRQAARFKIFKYTGNKRSYPTGDGDEITIGSDVNKKKVVDIIWTVHLANKKANGYALENDKLTPEEGILDGYEYGNLPPLRNLAVGSDPNNAARLKKLVIDPGPRAIRTVNHKEEDCKEKKHRKEEEDCKVEEVRGVKFDKGTRASFCDPGTPESCLDAGNTIEYLDNYPKSFPDDSFSKLYHPEKNIDTLGELRTDPKGRLLVLPAYGRTCAWYKEDGSYYPLNKDIDNDGWFDDTADGPVSAVIVLDDDSTLSVHGGWVITTDPGYAPQIPNVVSLWDSIYDTWLRKLYLNEDIYNGGFLSKHEPSFDDDLLPIFNSTALQQWVSNLPKIAENAHEAVGKIKGSDEPIDTILTGLAFIRNPNNYAESGVGPPLMPLSLGDTGQSFLSPTFTQYFFLSQWDKNKSKEGTGPKLGPGEFLDKAVLTNCLGGRFSPGIDMTFIVRQPDIYIQDWQESQSGPFRINAKKMDYKNLQSSQPFLSEGYVPLHSNTDGLEPGDTSKFMSIPWHTDYNSCVTHKTSPPTPTDAPPTHYSNTLYWSWPAQRPVAVYPAKDAVVAVKKTEKKDVEREQLVKQRYSVRGKGTESKDYDPSKAGRYQDREDILENWYRIGVVIQGSSINGPVTYNTDLYLEVQSLLDEPEVEPWPINELTRPDNKDDQ